MVPKTWGKITPSPWLPRRRALLRRLVGGRIYHVLHHPEADNDLRRHPSPIGYAHDRGQRHPICLGSRKEFFGFKTYDVYWPRRERSPCPKKTVADCVDHPDLARAPPRWREFVHEASSNTARARFSMPLPDEIHSPAPAPRLLDRLGWLEMPDAERARRWCPFQNRQDRLRPRPAGEGDVGYPLGESSCTPPIDLRGRPRTKTTMSD